LAIVIRSCCVRPDATPWSGTDVSEAVTGREHVPEEEGSAEFAEKSWRSDDCTISGCRTFDLEVLDLFLDACPRFGRYALELRESGLFDDNLAGKFGASRMDEVSQRRLVEALNNRACAGVCSWVLGSLQATEGSEVDIDFRRQLFRNHLTDWDDEMDCAVLTCIETFGSEEIRKAMITAAELVRFALACHKILPSHEKEEEHEHEPVSHASFRPWGASAEALARFSGVVKRANCHEACELIYASAIPRKCEELEGWIATERLSAFDDDFGETDVSLSGGEDDSDDSTDEVSLL